MPPLTLALTWLLALTPLQQTPISTTPAAGAPATSPAAQKEAEPLAIGEGVSKPEKISGAEPQYPMAAREQGITGRVILSLWIEKDGSTSHVEVLEGLGHGLDQAAQQALRVWRFKPAMKDGQPVIVRTRISVRFVLEDG